MDINDLKERYNEDVNSVSKIQSMFEERKIVNLNSACNILWNKHETFFVFENANKKLEAKNHLIINGLLDEFKVLNFNARLFDHGLRHICYAILSDNEELIQRYSKLRYYQGENAPFSMDEMVALGESPIWCNTIQFFMANDHNGIEKNLNIIEIKSLKKLPKKELGLLDDYEFYKALYNGDKSKMEEVLEKLTSHKIHKQRNEDNVLNKFISLPALGYAKLAWRKGIEVEVKSELVPKELLSIRPLENYKIPYDFLK